MTTNFRRSAALLMAAALLALASGNEPAQCVPIDPALPSSCAEDCGCEALCVDGACLPPELAAMSPEALHDALAAGEEFLLVNAHVPYGGEIEGTDAHLTYQDIPALATFIGPALDTPVVVYCMTNHMATIAGDALLELGYCDVRYLDGGMRGWTGAGYPLLP